MLLMFKVLIFRDETVLSRDIVAGTSCLDCQLRVKERLEHPPTPDLSDDEEGRRRARGGGGDKVSTCVVTAANKRE